MLGRRRRSLATVLALGVAAALIALLTGCGRAGSSPATASASGIEVVAAENFWGSIAATGR